MQTCCFTEATSWQQRQSRATCKASRRRIHFSAPEPVYRSHLHWFVRLQGDRDQTCSVTLRNAAVPFIVRNARRQKGLFIHTCAFFLGLHATQTVPLQKRKPCYLPGTIPGTIFLIFARSCISGIGDRPVLSTDDRNKLLCMLLPCLHRKK